MDNILVGRYNFFTQIDKIGNTFFISTYYVDIMNVSWKRRSILLKYD